MKNRFKALALVVLGITITGSSVEAKVNAKEALDIAFVDSFQAMRECADGQRVGKELDAMRDRLSKEIQDEAILITKEETDLKAKAATLKPDVLAQNERKIAKQKRDLEEKVRESEDAMKVAMQQKTEELAVKIEEGIVEVAKAQGVDVVLDKMSGRVMYTKGKGDLTNEAIAYVDKKSATTVAKSTAPKTATAAA